MQRLIACLVPLAALLAVSFCVTFVVSLFIWGYGFNAPVMQVSSDAKIVALSYRQLNPDIGLVVLNREHLREEALTKRCRDLDQDCPLVRTLEVQLGRLSAEELDVLPELEGLEARLQRVERSKLLFTGSGGRCGALLVAELEHGGVKEEIWSAISCELHADTYRFSELRVRDGVFGEYSFFLYDVAGAEFITPRVLLVAFTLLFSLIYGVGFFAGRGA